MAGWRDGWGEWSKLREKLASSPFSTRARPKGAKDDAVSAGPSEGGSPEPLRWRSSHVHLMLLSQFDQPRDAGGFADPEWDRMLGEPAEAAIAKLAADGALVLPTLAERLAAVCPPERISSLLAARGVASTGSPLERAERFERSFPKEASEELGGRMVLRSSPEAASAASGWAAAAAKVRAASMAKCAASLREGRFAAACREARHFDKAESFSRPAGSVRPAQGGPVDEAAVVALMFESPPARLAGVSPERWRALATAGAMQALWGEQPADWAALGEGPKAAEWARAASKAIRNRALRRWALGRFKAAGVESVLVSASCPGDCEPCRRKGGRMVALAEAPELPCVDCESPLGCDCSYAPVA